MESAMKQTPGQPTRTEGAVLGGSHTTGLLDIGALAAHLGVTPRFVRRLVHERRVPFLKIGKFVRFDPGEIERWVDECRTPVGSLGDARISRGAAAR